MQSGHQRTELEAERLERGQLGRVQRWIFIECAAQFAQADRIRLVAVRAETNQTRYHVRIARRGRTIDLGGQLALERLVQQQTASKSKASELKRAIQSSIHVLVLIALVLVVFAAIWLFLLFADAHRDRHDHCDQQQAQYEATRDAQQWHQGRFEKSGLTRRGGV